MKAQQEYPIALTADGKPFSHSAIYFFFCKRREEVRDSSRLRRIDSEHLGSAGYRVVAIKDLHADRTAAIEDAQKHYLAEIEKCRQKIRQFEADKPPKERSLKMIAMANE